MSPSNATATLRIAGLFLLFFLSLPVPTKADASLAPGDILQKVNALDSRVKDLESHKLRDGAGGLALFLCGVFCALWAQNTRRNPWLWFFMGAFFSAITLIVLLMKNADDRAKASSSSSQGTPGWETPRSPATCPACNAAILPGTSTCPKCGWTYVVAD